jgi:hypothetical protein
MSSSTVDVQHILVTNVKLTDDALRAELSDGRTISAPLSWYPRLCHASPEERTDRRLIGGGRGIHWPQLDEDISADNLVRGQPSAESQASLERRLQSRAADPRW